jgi:hypothetical protein
MSRSQTRRRFFDMTLDAPDTYANLVALVRSRVQSMGIFLTKPHYSRHGLTTSSLWYMFNVEHDSTTNSFEDVGDGKTLNKHG